MGFSFGPVMNRARRHSFRVRKDGGRNAPLTGNRTGLSRHQPSRSGRKTALPTQPFSVVRAADEAKIAHRYAGKPTFCVRAMIFPTSRYRLMMSGGRKASAGRVRVKLPQGVTWDQPRQHAARRNPPRATCCRPGSCRCLMSSRRPAARCFPNNQIDEIARAGKPQPAPLRCGFDLPDRFTPEFPPPIFLSSHPELGDMSHGKFSPLRTTMR